MNKLIAFDVYSFMAHFRKFYTNSSSLSYYFPPKTVVAGMIAGILGFKRDTYYEIFDEKAKIAVEIRTPLRKKIQTLNYLSVKEPKHTTGIDRNTQVPVEFVMPKFDFKMVIYRIYFAHEDKNLYDNLKQQLKQNKYKYPPYMGITELPAVTRYIGEFEFQEFVSHEKFEISTPVRVETVHGIKELFNFKGNTNIHKDKMPESFKAGRFLKQTANYLFRPDAKPMVLTLTSNLYKLNVNPVKYISFL